MGAFVETP
jgi:hypothetical protein